MQEENWGFLQVLYPACPYVNILYKHRTYIKTKKITLVQYYYIKHRTYVDGEVDQWSKACKDISSQVKDNLQYLVPSATKNEYLVDLFRLRWKVASFK